MSDFDVADEQITDEYEGEVAIEEEDLDDEIIDDDEDEQFNSKSAEDRVIGNVKWFNNAKGFGFIQRDGVEEDIFVHFSQIRGDGYRSLSEGQRVEFSIEKSQKGLRAEDVIAA